MVSLTRDEITSMAREAGFTNPEQFNTSDEALRGILADFWVNLERFAALVAAAEREACAKLCDDLIMSGPVCEVQQRYNKAYMDCRDKILSRGEQ